MKLTNFRRPHHNDNLYHLNDCDVPDSEFPDVNELLSEGEPENVEDIEDILQLLNEYAARHDRPKPNVAKLVGILVAAAASLAMLVVTLKLLLTRKQ